MIKAVVFDVGGVLLLPSGERLAAAIASRTGISLEADRCRDAWTEALHEFDAAAGNGGGERAVWETRWMEKAGVPPDRVADALEAYLAENGKPRSLWSDWVPGGHDALARLAGAGMRLGAVSNSDGRVAAELEEDGFLGFFEVVVDSAVVGVAKPDPRIFDFFFEAFPGVARDECLYVGDSTTWDVPAALAAGLIPCHFDRLGIYGAAGNGLRRIRSLAELPEVVSAF